MRNFILVKDKVFDDETCDQIIEYYKTQKPIKEKYYNIVHNPPLFKKDNIQNFFNEYFNVFHEIQTTKGKLFLTELRIKHFMPNNYFSKWHHEFSIDNPHRVLAFMVYLSDHDCGTEFSTGECLKSKKGRGVIFPSYFTHTHRGQKCPNNKDRYIFAGYFHVSN